MAYLPSLVLVVVAVIGVVGQWIAGRNDRALALQEAELLDALPDDMTASRARLRRVLAFRTMRWERAATPVGKTVRTIFRLLAATYVLFALRVLQAGQVAAHLRSPRVGLALGVLFWACLILATVLGVRGLVQERRRGRAMVDRGPDQPKEG